MFAYKSIYLGINWQESTVRGPIPVVIFKPKWPPFLLGEIRRNARNVSNQKLSQMFHRVFQCPYIFCAKKNRILRGEIPMFVG